MGSSGLGVYYVTLAGPEEEAGGDTGPCTITIDFCVDSINQLSPRKWQKLHLGWSRVQKL